MQRGDCAALVEDTNLRDTRRPGIRNGKPSSYPCVVTRTPSASRTPAFALRDDAEGRRCLLVPVTRFGRRVTLREALFRETK